MSADPLAFLRAALDAAQAEAETAADGDSGEWFVGDKWNVYRAENETPLDDTEENQLVVYGNMRAQSDHIAAHDPASALRRVAADRALLRLHSGGHECAVYERGEINAFAYVHDSEPCSTVLIIAEQYGWTDLPTCGAHTVFWPEDEACDAECMLRPWHEGKHKDATLGEFGDD